MGKRQPTTKDIGLLLQLYEDDQLQLAPEFQRNSVWPRPAKAYLIDTILHDRPIPLFFLQRARSPQTGRPTYSVIDGQQRLRAIIEFTEDRFPLTQSAPSDSWYGKRFSQLSEARQQQILDYDLVIQELHGYSESDIKDSFIRINKYVVKLSPQELRHAREHGKFSEYVTRIGNWAIWKQQRIISPTQIKRMRPAEFAAELLILLIEGPQDKKASIDLYYVQYRNRFPFGKQTEEKLKSYLDWVVQVVPDFSRSRYRRPVDLYSLVGALDSLVSDGWRLQSIPRRKAGEALSKFERQTRSSRPSKQAARYLSSASQQTDNITPRSTRIEILADLLRASRR